MQLKMKERRLFVGNLPNDVSETGVEGLFKNYNVSKVEIKRKKVLDEESVFAFVNVSSDDINDCLNEFKNKKWRNCNLKVELAKESFLDRLKKEHSEKNKKQNTTTFGDRIGNNSFQLRQNSNDFKNKKIVFDSDDEVEKTNSCDVGNSSLEDIPKKRNLPMFRGTASVVTEKFRSLNTNLKTDSCNKPNAGIKSYSEPNVDRKRYSKPNVDTESYGKSNRDIKSSANEAYFAMRKFEEFSDVWKDEPVQISNKEYKKFTFKSKTNLNEDEEKVTKNIRENEPESNPEDSKRINFKSKFHSEDKQKSIAWKRPLSIDKSNETSSISNKNDEKLESWKSTVADDDRFRLDEKFFDSDDVPPLNKKQKSSQSLGDKLQKNNSTNSILEHRQLVRYDPTRPEHKILEKNTPKNTVLQSTMQKEKKKKMKKLSEKQNIETNEKQVHVKPEVSKEKHYSVADTLKDAFKNTGNQGEFRLSALFDQQIKQENSSLPKRQVESKAVPLDTLEKNATPQSSDSEYEEEMDEEPAEILPTPASEKVLGKCGVWGETFFFKKDDSRLQEAIDFFKPEDKKNITDFDKQRIKLRSIVRKKLQNSRKDNKLFKEKLGGKINKSKFKMRLKKAHG